MHIVVLLHTEKRKSLLKKKGETEKSPRLELQARDHIGRSVDQHTRSIHFASKEAAVLCRSVRVCACSFELWFYLGLFGFQELKFNFHHINVLLNA
jgi:hypothetical protein